MNRRRRLVLRRRTSSSNSRSNFDEPSQPLSFARPASASMPNRLSISATSYASARLSLEAPLPSPCVSDVSRAESVEGAPSLVSDSGSTYTTSPCGAASPNIELPPLNSFSSYRRPSLPALQFPTHSTYSDADDRSQTATPRYAGEAKTYALSTLSAPLYRTSEGRYGTTPSPHDYYHDSRAQLPTAPPTPMHLPRIQGLQQQQQRLEQPVERDSRMHLSSLLG